MDQYMAMGHIAAQFGPPRKPSVEQRLLLKHGIARRVEVAVSHFSLIPHMVQRTELIATMLQRLAMHFAAILPLRILQISLPIPGFAEALQWPAGSENDAASVWLMHKMLEGAETYRADGRSQYGSRG
jgi:LysR family nod box-dependent transcriptional activator